MQTTTLGLKKPDLSDGHDLMTFVGQNMDTLEALLQERKPTKVSTTKPTDGSIWIDVSDIAT